MEDDELQAIRARRLAELQAKSGGAQPSQVKKKIRMKLFDDKTNFNRAVFQVLEAPPKMMQRKGNDNE
jgi:DNA-binding TFAR19-related protein (PDSD5 family)